jgi:hypothetical protein
VSIGGDGIGGDHETNNPIYRPSLGRTATLVGDHLVVMPPPRQVRQPRVHTESAGLLVYALTDPLAPTLVGRLDLPGWPLQMFADKTTLTLAVRAPRALDQKLIPATSLQDQSTLLVEVDLENPAAPRKVAEIEVGDGFWEFARRDGYVFVLSEQAREQPSPCGFPGETSRAAAVQSMRVSSYGIGAEGFKPVAEVELPFDGYVAFTTTRGFVAVTDTYGQGPSISAARFGPDGSLLASAPASVPGEVRAVAESGDVLGVVTGGNLNRISTFSLADAAKLAPLGAAELPGAGFRLKAATLGGRQVMLADGYLVRLDDPATPQIVPIELGSRLLITGDRLLSARANEVQQLTLSLFGFGPDDTLTKIASVQPKWPSWDSGSWAEDPAAWDETTGRFVYPFSAGAAAPALGVAQVTGDAIDVHEAVPTGYGQALLANDAAYVIDETSMQAAGLSGVSSPGQTTSFFGAEEVLQEIDVSGRAARLLRQGDELFISLAVAGDQALRFPVPHFVDELVLTERYLLAAGLWQNPDCERFAGNAPIELEMFCPKPISRGLTFIPLGDANPQPITILINNQLDALQLPADSTQQTSWEGFVRTTDGRLVFPVTRTISCNSAASCATLGLPAYKSFGSPGYAGCPTGKDCPPMPPPGPLEMISGFGSQSLLYAIDLTKSPQLGPPTGLAPSSGRQGRFDFQSQELAQSLDLGAEVLRAGDVLGFPTKDPEYNDDGNSVTDTNGQALIRYGLELVRIGEGQLQVGASVSTPGRPVALTSDASRLFSVEPRMVDSKHIVAVLHRSDLRGNGAYIEQSAELGPGYRDGLEQDGRAYFLTGPEDYCAPDPTSELFYVDLARPDLTMSQRAPLPFGNWGLVRSAPAKPDILLLNGGPLGYRGRAEVDVSTDQLAVARYYSVQ